MKVLLEAPILTQSGYGEHSRLVFEAINNIISDISINPLPWGQTPWIVNDTNDDIHRAITRFHENTKISQNYDLQIHVGIPNEFVKKAPYSVCVTAGIETNRVSANWLIKTHQGIDKLIVPSNHSRNGFVDVSYEVEDSNTGQKGVVSCNCPVDVVPYPFKNFINEESIQLDFKTDFNFLTIALLGPRKNLENSIEWFLQEFKDDPNVGFVIKTAKSRASIMDRSITKKHIENLTNKYKDSKCKVYLLHGNLSESEINSIYASNNISAYVTATHGEGFGLPIFEAAYNGIPVVATDWSGHLDFLSCPEKKSGKTKKMFARVNYSLSEIPKEVVWKDILVEGSLWANVNQKSFKDQMRKVYSNYGMYKKWAETLKDHIRNTHDKQKILTQMSDSIFAGLNVDLAALKRNNDWFSDISEIGEM